MNIYVDKKWRKVGGAIIWKKKETKDVNNRLIIKFYLYIKYNMGDLSLYNCFVFTNLI